jgi:hypothetical protein
MPFFAHRDEFGKCSHTNRTYKFVNNLKVDQEEGFNLTKRPSPWGEGKTEKENEPKDGSDMDEDPTQAPKPFENAEASSDIRIPLKIERAAYTTPS